MSGSSSPTNNSITAGDWLREATRLLSASGIDTARLDSQVMLADAIGADRSTVLAHLDEPLHTELVCDLNDAIQRRSNHLPLAYIRGKVEFYGREFVVTPEVLVPRPESESIINLLLQHPGLAALRQDPQLMIADIGSGSGALAVTAKLALPAAHIYAVDIDDACLDVTRQNAHKYRCVIQCLHGDLLEPLVSNRVPLDTSILLCNLPYVPAGFPVNQAAKHEPALALYAGNDGLDAFRALFAQIQYYDHKPCAIVTEAMPEQHAPLAALAAAEGYNQTAYDGLAQLFMQVTAATG